MAESKKTSITVKADDDNLMTVTSAIEEAIQGIDISPKTEMHINMSVEELFVNICHYAYEGKEGEAVVDIEVTDDPLTLFITFKDSGTPYDPLAKDDPDVTLSAQERQIGGLGIFLVKKMMDDVIYRYENGQNILTIKKILR